MSGHQFHLALVLNVVATIASARTGFCAVPSDALARDYSAVESLRKAGELLGKPLSVVELLVDWPEATRSWGDCQRFVERHGLHGTLLINLDARQLSRIDHPVLLKVKGSENSGDYDRFVLYV